MPPRRRDDLPDDSDRFERWAEHAAQAAAAKPLAVTDGEQGKRRSRRNADRPRERYRALRVPVVDEHEDRADERTRREDGVLERAETEHPDPGLVGRHAEILERLDVDGESAARNEHPEPGGDDRGRAQPPELDAAAHVGDLPVREGVADVGGDGARDREREPVRVRVPETGGDGHVTSRPGDEDRCDERQRGGDDHQHHDVVCLVVAVVCEHHAEGAATPIALSCPARHRPLVPKARTRDAPGRIRTSDPRIRSPPLCPLSYGRALPRVEPSAARVGCRAWRTPSSG